MQSRDNLTKRFGNATLPLILAGQPFANSDEDIFQMDILNRGRTENFRLYPGHKDNQVHVQGTDKKLRQLVLFVREPKRSFEVVHPVGRWTKKEVVVESLRRSGATIARIHPTKVIERRTTPDSKRHYLCGHDESHLFIAQLPVGVSTVRDAHDALRAPDARDKDARRQGEWFFIALTDGEEQIVEHAISQGLLLKDMPIGVAFDQPRTFGRRQRNKRKLLAGHAHLAEEVIVIRHLAKASRSVDVYARGKIRHVDHKTIELRSWTRVARNNEPAQLTGGHGIHWID